MSRLQRLFAPLSAVTLILASGEFSTRTHSYPVSPSLPFQPKPLAQLNALLESAQRADDLERFASDPRLLIEHAIATLDPMAIRWQSMTILQRARTDDVAFEARATLMRGPKHCARLETTLQAGGTPGRVLVVCDGVVLGRLVGGAGKETLASSTALPTFSDSDLATLYEREKVLVANGCGGPHALLVDLKSRLLGLRFDSGLIGAIAVFRLNGSFDGERKLDSQGVGLLAPAHSCSVYLDVNTLLPVRIEWHGARGVVLELEYRDVRLNEALTHEQCVRAFTLSQ